jgi:YidC/Oxa1 family membrane protein insertase
MGKTETIGIIIITLVLFLWMYLNAPKQPPRSAQHTEQSQPTQESNNSPSTNVVPPGGKKLSEQPQNDTTGMETYGKSFAPLATGTGKTITIKTSLYIATLTTEGGMIKSWSLTKFNTWRGKAVQLVNYESEGDYSLLFQTTDGKLIDTKDLYFNSAFNDGQVITLSDSQRYSISFTMSLTDSAEIIRVFSFKGGVYDFGSNVEFRNMDHYIANDKYEIAWERGLNYTEQNSVDESSFSTAYAYVGGETSTLEASKVGDTLKHEWNTGWVSQTTKYFTAAMAQRGKPAYGYDLRGIETKAPDNGLTRSYYTSLQVKFEGQPYQVDSFMVYVGPLDYRLLKSYNVGLEETVGLGWRWLIRPISEYLMLPAFQFIHSFIPNYGVAIIIFSILLKLLLNPLTASSMKSMRRMQALQPMMNEIKEKYKEDPQKMNQAVMSLYKEYKINPMGGCLPMALQMPILYALWAIFRSNIELRQSNFVWWIKDLSVPDTILHLPFTIPVLGMSQVSGLALLMAITMFVQQKMSVKDPRQQFMVWFMPVFFWILFNNFPSGLNLYYFVFNILSIGQQYLMNKKPQEELLLKPAPVKKEKMRLPRPPVGNRFMRRNM